MAPDFPRSPAPRASHCRQLPAPLIHRDVLHADGLLASGSVSLERLDLRRKGAGELIEGALRAVLLRDVVHMSEPAREGHGRVVNSGHLSREHRLHLVPRLYALDHREQEIEPTVIHGPTFCRGIGELCEKPVYEVRFRCSKRLHEK